MCATVTQSIFETKAFHRLPDWTALARFISQKNVRACVWNNSRSRPLCIQLPWNKHRAFVWILAYQGFVFFRSLHRVFSQKCGKVKCGRELVRVDKAHNGRIKRRRLSSLILWVIKKCSAHKHAKWRGIALNIESIYRDGGVKTSVGVRLNRLLD